VNNANTGAEDGKSWSTAFKTIQPAIDLAGSAGGGEVWVARGLYREARSHIWANANTGSLALQPGVTLLGGFAGNETSSDARDVKQNPTVISGKTARDGNPAYHVVIGANNAVIDGFTVRDGLENGEHVDHKSGGGIFCVLHRMTIRNCIVEYCGDDNLGAGIFAWDGKLDVISTTVRNNRCDYIKTNPEEHGCGGGLAYLSPRPPQPTDGLRVESCTFENNASAGRGGGLYVRKSAATIVNSTFEHNNGLWGGGVAAYVDSSVSISSSAFTNNVSTHGGGLRIAHRTTSDLTQCTFRANTSYNLGAGINYYFSGPAKMADCNFDENISKQDGGAVRLTNASLQAAGCAFRNNSANAGGMLSSLESSATFDNCTVTGNTPFAIQATTDHEKILATNTGFGENGVALYRIDPAQKTFGSVAQLAQAFPAWSGNRYVPPSRSAAHTITAARAPAPQLLPAVPQTENTEASIEITTQDTSITITGIYALTAAIAIIFIVGVLGLVVLWQRSPYPERPARISWPDE
jgi:hypothetical protein